mgnify:FL=1
MKTAEKIGVQVPDLLLPNQTIDMHKWAVIACDQFTSQPEYWERVRETVGDAPSTFKLILPEAWLESPEAPELIKASHQAMRDYVAEGVFTPYKGFMLVERTVGDKIQTGLIAALDLETYDYTPGSKTLIRASEGTVLDRLPPRMAVRREAIIESPHILVLFDDPEMTVLKDVLGHKEILPLVYDFDLMEGSGHITGHLVDKPELIDSVIEALAALIEPEYYAKKYDLPAGTPPMLFAMGDGNHSLATAKAIWEEVKADVGMDHPARYALVELVNIHDVSLQFEAIHRVLFNAGELKKDLVAHFGEHIQLSKVDTMDALVAEVTQDVAPHQRFGLIDSDGFTVAELTQPVHNLSVGNVQEYLDPWLKAHPETQIDYVHGDDITCELSQQPGNLGIYLPSITKFTLFKSIILDGALPRKTFSMNHAHDKRFYLECRKIR